MSVAELRKLCHDLRGEVAAVAMAIAAVRIDPEVPPRQLERLQTIETQCLRLCELVQETLERTSKPERLDVTQLVAESIQVTQLGAGAVIDITGEPAVVTADWTALRRIFANLVENAVRAAGEEGRVRVSVSQNEQEVWVDVDDSGPGFGQSPRGTASLGLSIVHELVSRYGGRLEIAMSDLGGARVRVVLRAVEE